MGAKCEYLIKVNKTKFCFWNTKSTYRESEKHCKDLNSNLVTSKKPEVWLELKKKVNRTIFDYWTGFEYCKNKMFSENGSSPCKTYNFYDSGIRYNESNLRKALIIRFGLPWTSKPRATLGYIHKNVKKRFICESIISLTNSSKIVENSNVSIFDTKIKKILIDDANRTTSTNNIIMFAVVPLVLMLIAACFILLVYTKKGKKLIDNKKYSAARKWTDVKTNLGIKKSNAVEAFNKKRKKAKSHLFTLSDQQNIK